MHRRIWFLAIAALAVMALVGSASAMGGGSSKAVHYKTGKVLPFSLAQSTPAQRAAKTSINVAEEQDLQPHCGWNVLNANCTLAWSTWIGWNPILRGPYVVAFVNGKYVYKYDLATKVVATKTGITYTIRKNAKWNWGGKMSPVTYKDFVYTVELLNNPKNNVASNTGVNQLTSYTHSGNNVVTFKWKTKASQTALGGGVKTKGCTGSNACGAFADYKDLLGSILPQAATQHSSFNTNMFSHCICGSNGKYVTDGPYYMSHYTRGQGVTLTANLASGAWYGVKPHIKTVNFLDESSTNSEIQAIKGGEVDAAAPQPVPSIAQLKNQPGLTYHVQAGNYLEHIDLQQGNSGPDTPGGTLIKNNDWFRQAIMMGIDREGLISAALPGVAPGLKPLNSLLVFQSDSRYKNAFGKWNYDAQGAIDKLKAHGCTGGPNHPSNSNTDYFTCNGHLAEYTEIYAPDNARRNASIQIIQANEKAIGIKVDLDGEDISDGPFFDLAAAGNYNAIEFAWGGSIDPGGFYAIWSCGGGQNWLHYCNHTVSAKLQAANSELNSVKRNADFIAADAGMSNDVPAIPLYALPEVTVYKNKVGGITGNPAAGFTWNLESWFWKS